jgi:cell division transport system permease protein
MAFKPTYYISETFSNLRRNLLMTTTAIITVLISLFMLGGVLLLNGMVSNVTLQFKGNIQLRVYLRNDITSAQLQALQAKIANDATVKDSKFYSHDDAYKEFQELFKDEPDIIDAVTPETLPQSFAVSLKDPSPQSISALEHSLQGEPGVDEIKDSHQLTDRLFSFTHVVRLLGIAVVVVLLTAAVMLIANTIRLAIFARRREIGVMKLVGATNWFIRIPFMIEGLLEGILGGGLAFAAVWTTKTVFIDQRLRNSLPFLPGISIGSGQLFTIAVVTVVVGGIVGAVGSAIALRRFLDV